VDPHQIVTPPVRIYADPIPHNNASIWNYTIDDARNDANFSLPGYYRKSDLLRSGYVDSRGVLVVPPTAPLNGDGSIDIRPYNGAVRPATAPRPVIIIPKDLLDKPLSKPDPGSQKVVLAK